MHLQADIRRAFLKMEEVEQGHEWDSIEAEIREEFDRLEKGIMSLATNMTNR